MRILEALARVRTFMVATAVIIGIVLIALTIAGPRPDGSLDTGLSDVLMGVVVPLTFLTWMAVGIAHRICLYRRIESYESRDASQPPVAPAPRLYAQESALVGLGFQPVGQLEFRWPWQKWKMTWVFTNPTYRVDTALGILRLPAFSSHWADGSSLTTVRGLQARVIDRPHARLVSTSGPIEAMYARHLQQADDFGQGRGERLPTRSMVDVLAWDAAEVPHLRDSMRAVLLRPGPLLALALVALLMLVLVVSELRSL